MCIWTARMFPQSCCFLMHNFHRVLQASKGPRNYIGRSQNHSYFSWTVTPSKDNQTDNWKNARKKEIKGTFFPLVLWNKCSGVVTAAYTPVLK